LKHTALDRLQVRLNVILFNLHPISRRFRRQIIVLTESASP